MSGKEASDNEDTEETVTIVQEVKAADKINLLAENELKQSEFEENKTESVSKTSNATSN